MKLSDGRKIYRSVKKEGKGWGVNVWPHYERNPKVRRHYYRSRSQARTASYTDPVGAFGRVA